MLTKKIGKEKTVELACELDAIIAAGSREQFTQNERAVLAYQMIKCLTTYIEEEMKLPATINTIVTHFCLLQHSVDLQFPGYIEAGLLQRIILPRGRIA